MLRVPRESPSILLSSEIISAMRIPPALYPVSQASGPATLITKWAQSAISNERRQLRAQVCHLALDRNHPTGLSTDGAAYSVSRGPALFQLLDPRFQFFDLRQ